MRILVLGAAGMLGHKIYRELLGEFPDAWAGLRQTRATYDHLGLFSKNLTIDGWDLTNRQLLVKNLASCNPNWIINCAGVTPRKASGQSMSQLVQVNSLLSHLLNDWCQENDARLLHFSTDCVFSGKSGPYQESDPKDASDPYGQSKALGEVGGTHALTLRSSIIGFELTGHTELLGWLIEQRGKAIKGYSRALYSGVTTNWMAQTVTRLIKHHQYLCGIVQIASEPISKFDLLQKLNSALRLNCTIIPDESVISDKRLNGSRFVRETGIQVPPWAEMIDQLTKEFAFYQGLTGRSVA